LSNINFITPKEGVNSPYNNCIFAEKEEDFSGIISLSEGNIDVLDFYEASNFKSGLLRVDLGFDPTSYITNKDYISLLNRCNSVIGNNTIQQMKRDGNGNQYLLGSRYDYYGFIFTPKPLDIEIKVVEGKSLAIIGNNIINSKGHFSIPANIYVPVRFILGINVGVYTNYSGDNIFYTTII